MTRVPNKDSGIVVNRVKRWQYYSEIFDFPSRVITAKFS